MRAKMVPWEGLMRAMYMSLDVIEIKFMYGCRPYSSWVYDMTWLCCNFA